VTNAWAWIIAAFVLGFMVGHRRRLKSERETDARIHSSFRQISAIERNQAK
jgi:hypothetical protein